MKPVVLPMLHLLVLCLLGMRKNSDRFARYIGLRAAAYSQHSLEFVRENFDEPRDQLVPVVENPLSAAAARQFSVTRDKVSDDLDILTVEQRLEIDRVEIAAFFGEIHVLVENIGDAATHASCEIPAAGAEHQHQPVRHVLAAVVADPLDDRSGSGVANREAFSGNSVEERFAARGAVKCNIADQDIFFGSKGGTLGWIHDDAAAGKALTHIVVGLAFESDRDSVGQKCSQTLSGRAVQVDSECLVWKSVRAVAACHLSTQHGSDRAMNVAYRQIDFKRTQTQ